VLAVGGSWEEVYAGREYVPAFWVALQGDPTGWNYVSQFGQYYGFANYNGSVLSDGSGICHSNMVGYKSPTFGGFRADLSVAAGEGSARKKVIDGSLVYQSGPIYVGLGYDGQDSDNRMYVVAAGYAFGFVRPAATYSDAKGGFSASAHTPTPLYEAKSFQMSFAFPVRTGKLYFGGARLNP
jgi:predicted porin